MGRDCHRQALDRTSANFDGIDDPAFCARLFQPVGVALGVPELQRIDCSLRHQHLRPLAIIERELQPLDGRQAHVMA